MRKVKVTTPGSTTNLGCGFDCLGLALSVYNTLEVQLTETDDILVEVEGEGKSSIPQTSDNIIFPALKLVFDKVQTELKGVYVKEVNGIPLEKGLGSSAATRVGAVVAANHLLEAGLSFPQILKLVSFLEGHPDNAAASLIGGLVGVANPHQASQDEDGPIWVRIPAPEHLRVVVILPHIKISTNKARSILPDKVSLSDAVFNLSRLAILVPSLAAGRWDNLPFATQDKLHQPYRASLLPGMEDVFKAALQAGAKGVFLSGAGSGIAAFSSPQKADRIGKVMREVFLRKKIKTETLILCVDHKGCRIDEES